MNKPPYLSLAVVCSIIASVIAWFTLTIRGQELIYDLGALLLVVGTIILFSFLIWQMAGFVIRCLDEVLEWLRLEMDMEINKKLNQIINEPTIPKLTDEDKVNYLSSESGFHKSDCQRILWGFGGDLSCSLEHVKWLKRNNKRWCDGFFLREKPK